MDGWMDVLVEDAVYDAELACRFGGACVEAG